MQLSTKEPDSSSMSDAHYDWEESIYVKVEVVLPTDAPEPLGNNVVAGSYNTNNLQL